MAQTIRSGRAYPAPGASVKTDGFNVDISGNEEFQAMLLRLGPLVVNRALNIVRVLGMQMAVEANAAAPRGAPRKGSSGGRLAKSFRIYDRPQWQQLGKIGVAVRSTASYHHYQEFGADKKGAQVVLHQDDAGKKVAKGRRYRDGTNRLRDGVRVKSYRRDIKIKANPFFGDIVRASKGKFEEQARNAIQTYISRISAEGA